MKNEQSKSGAPREVEAIYSSTPQPHQATMRDMREKILAISPTAEEIVSYGMPAFRVDGVIICGLKAAKKHVGYYPFSGSILHLFEKELAQYSCTKSALHVPIDTPLSKALLKKLITARLQQGK